MGRARSRAPVCFLIGGPLPSTFVKPAGGVRYAPLGIGVAAVPTDVGLSSGSGGSGGVGVRDEVLNANVALALVGLALGACSGEPGADGASCTANGDCCGGYCDPQTLTCTTILL